MMKSPLASIVISAKASLRTADSVLSIVQLEHRRPGTLRIAELGY